METTREAILRINKANPHLNLSDIARQVGVSRERVRQIVNEHNLEVRKSQTGIMIGTAPPEARIVTRGTPVLLSHSSSGTIGELMAAADLLARGFSVFFPLVRTGACDLITLSRDGSVERIEVRCGKRKKKGLIQVSFGDSSKYDRRAIVPIGEPVLYRPPFPGDQ